MRTRTDVEAMASKARVEELKAKDQALLSEQDTTAAREFAAGVEAGLLWAAGNIGEIPFTKVEHVKPSGNDGLDLDAIPGLSDEPECICYDSNAPARKDCPYCYPTS